MEFINIDKDKCIRCKTRSLVCPARLIDFDEEGYPKGVFYASKACLKCGHCVCVCPKGAIEVEYVKKSECRDISEFLGVEKTLVSRRSIRNFREEIPTEKEINSLLNISRYSPTPHNSQPLSWIVIRGREDVLEMTKKVLEWMKFCIKNKDEIAKKMNFIAIVRQWDKKNIDLINRSAPVILISVSKDKTMGLSAGISAGVYMEIFAPEKGLGSCQLGFLTLAVNESDKIRKHLSLQENDVCTGALAVGYPSYEYKSVPKRKEIDIKLVPRNI